MDEPTASTLAADFATLRITVSTANPVANVMDCVDRIEAQMDTLTRERDEALAVTKSGLVTRLMQRAEAAEAALADTRRALENFAKHELGEAFGADAGPCWCDPFYRGEKWPGHDEACQKARRALAGDTEGDA